MSWWKVPIFFNFFLCFFFDLFSLLWRSGLNSFGWWQVNFRSCLVWRICNHMIKNLFLHTLTCHQNIWLIFPWSVSFSFDWLLIGCSFLSTRFQIWVQSLCWCKLDFYHSIDIVSLFGWNSLTNRWQLKISSLTFIGFNKWLSHLFLY